MRKRDKAKLRKQYKEYLVVKNIYSPVHDILIDQLIDWIYIDDYAKAELANDPTSWTTISTVAVASKNIQSLTKQLGLTPQLIKPKAEVEKPIDLSEVIKEITSK